MDCNISLLTCVGQYYLMDGQVPGPIGSGHQSVVPYQAFATQDIYIVVAVFVEKFWEALCRVLGIEELVDDPRFCDNDHRRDNRDELVPILENILRTRPGEEWLRLLSEAQLPIPKWRRGTWSWRWPIPQWIGCALSATQSK